MFLFTLCTPVFHSVYDALAKESHRQFVSLFSSYCDEHKLVCTIHNLTHLPDDFLVYESLDHPLHLPFESSLGSLKTLINAHRKAGKRLYMQPPEGKSYEFLMYPHTLLDDIGSIL